MFLDFLRTYPKEIFNYMKKNILITGGAGFIGSHVVRLFANKYPQYNIINLDVLTYAGNLKNLSDVENSRNYKFIKGDICDYHLVEKIFSNENITDVIHLAAESHVDRSIADPFSFAKTNIIGTLTLLQVAKKYWLPNSNNNVFYHISTDEVYGSLESTDLFKEDSPYDPHSPYSASKASSDHFVRSFFDTYKLPIVISNCSNNYGPNQFPEKLIPLFINNIIKGIPLPVYGNGENIRDWLYVEDHAKAIDIVFHDGKIGQTYNIGGFNEWKNIDLIRVIIDVTDSFLKRKKGSSLKLITFIEDRAGHDKRYAIDATKIKNDLGWEPTLQFEEGIMKTVSWYLENNDWLNDITSGNYKNYYNKLYGSKLK